MKTTIAIGAAAIAAVLSFSSCNTVKGVGQDVESAGEGISTGANKVQKEIREH